MAIICFKEKEDGTVNVLVSGKVTQEPELKSNSKGNKVRFSIAYGKKKYMNVEAWSDSDTGTVAGCLEKGDIVAVTGSYREWQYNDKQYSSVTADAIFTMQLPLSAPVSAAPDDQNKYAPGDFADLDDEEDDLPF